MNLLDDENTPLTNSIDTPAHDTDIINDVESVQSELVTPIPTNEITTSEVISPAEHKDDTKTNTSTCKTVIDTAPEHTPTATNINIQPQQASGVNMRCMRCGNFSTSPFCPQCGQNIMQAYQPPQPPQQPPYGGYNPQQPINPQYSQLNQQFSTYGNQQYPPYRPKQKAPVASIVALILSVMMFFILIAMLLMTYRSTPESSTWGDDQIGFGGSQSEQYRDNDSGKNNSKRAPNGVSADEFAIIKTGMSYAQISAIIGGDGIITDSGTNIHNENYHVYGWGGEDNNLAVLYITFIDGKATEIDLDGDL